MRHASKLLTLAIALVASPVLAKSGDRNQPMDISADRTDAMLGDDSVSTLEGNVRIRQGTLEVDAARAEVHRAGGDPNRIVLTGEPARLRQVSDTGEPMEATASRIVYMLADESMMLTGNVVITQVRGTLRGETIKYDINTGRLNGGNDGARVNMRILPKSAATTD
ncbi:lipopolysaccharide transport periplasmic protein LptA [Arenimonas sp.]|uniref:lipopolysaccharide transport periplasmic protein LptA n=1 Tax=Arenimonas sp. TaxID=1872635 RepID=UPI0035B2777F